MQYIIFSFVIHFCYDLFMDNLRCSVSRGGFPSIACKMKMQNCNGEEARVRQRHNVCHNIGFACSFFMFNYSPWSTLHPIFLCFSIICPLMVPYNCTKFLFRDNGTNEQEAIERWLKWPPEDHHSSLASLLQAKIQSILIKQNTNTLALDVKILYKIQILRKVAHLNVLMRKIYL